MNTLLRKSILSAAALALIPALRCLALVPDISEDISAAPHQDWSIGVDPKKDSVDLKEFQDYLAGIRKTRPTVALVLSGGGAKGASHIGVLEYLESEGIPVDVVLGTSMGGLIGGLFSLGYSAVEMDSLIRTINWNTALTDNVPRSYISYRGKKYREKFLLSFPFYYAKQDYLEKLEMDIQYAGAENKHSRIHFGAGKDDATDLVKSNLLGSLPSGFAFGQNVNNIISSYSVGYQDSTDFVDLPVPFVCVATEMVTARPKIWFGGKINTALRSTMSIPGVFAPVKVDGMVLVDGGMRNNYPTDLAKKMGADIIIGVDLSSGFRDYSGLNNLGDIISQGVDMLGRASYENNVSIPDVTIKPYLPEFNMMSFDDKSIDIIIRRGREAAMVQSRSLDSIKSVIGDARPRLRNRKAIDINKNAVMISKVEIKGVSDKESLFLMDKIGIRPNTRVDNGEIEDAVATIFGTQAFDYVTYELEGTHEPFGLTLHCKRGPVHQIGMSGRFDSEEIVSVLLNLGINAHKLQGHCLDLTGKVGTNPYAGIHYYVSSPKGPTFNITSSVKWVDRNKFKLGTSDYNVAYANIREEMYLSNIQWRNLDCRAGVRSDYFKLNKVMTDKVSGDYDLGGLSNNYFSLFGDISADTFDDGYFPTKGFSLNVGYEWFFAGMKQKIDQFHVVTLGFKTVANMDFFAIIPSLTARYMFGGDPALPYMNLMGGSLAGRYLDQQIPFIGINYASSMMNLLTVARTDFRFRLFKNNYLTAMVNYACSFSELEDITNAHKIYGLLGAGVKYSYNSIIGPMEFDLHWRSRNRKAGAYFSIGLSF